jgi:hypothetical protein
MLTWHDYEAMNQRPVSLAFETPALPLSNGVMIPGTNVFAIQLHRRGTRPITASFTASIPGIRTVINTTTRCRYFDGYSLPSGQVRLAPLTSF